MKNTFKKIVAVAMAFTILGTGTAITKTVAPKFDNKITVYAGGVPQKYCKHPDRFNYNRNGYVYCEACGKRLYALPAPAPTPTPTPKKR